MAGSAAGPGRMHTSASAHAKLPGSNEHMSLRLKAVGQQVFKICNRKGRLSGGERGRGRRGPGGRETDRERERGGNQKKKRKRHLLLLVTREEGKGRSAVAGTAWEGRLEPNQESFAHLGSNLLGRGLKARGCVRAAGGGHAGTHRHTHIYICAHMYIYICMFGRAGDVSLSGKGWWARAGNHMLRSWPEEDHQNTRLSGEKIKGVFRHQHGQRGTLPRTVQPEAPALLQGRAMR